MKGKLQGDFHGHNSFRAQELGVSHMKRTVGRIERIKKRESKIREIKSKNQRKHQRKSV